MATCTNCGANLGPTDKFCGVCGTPAAADGDGMAGIAEAAEESVAGGDVGAGVVGVAEESVAGGDVGAGVDGAAEESVADVDAVTDVVEAAPESAAVPEEVPSRPITQPGSLPDIEPTGASIDEESSLDDVIDERAGLWGTLDGATGRAKTLSDKISKEDLGSGATTTFDLSKHPDPFEQLDELKIAAESEIGLLRDVNKAIDSHESAIAEIKRKQMQKVVGGIIAAVIIIIILANAFGG